MIAAGDTDGRLVIAAWLTRPVPDGCAVWYQSVMAQHLLPGMELDWVHVLTNVLLIRDPAEVSRVLPEVARHRRAHRHRIAATGGALTSCCTPAAASAARCSTPDDFLRDPEAHLRALCTHLGIAFDERMLRWPAGPRASDGVWAPA